MANGDPSGTKVHQPASDEREIYEKVMTQYTVDIGAMEEEVALLRENISNPKVETIAGCEYTSGTMKDKDVILLRSGIGKVNAAMSTAVLLQHFKPDCIINTGSAGGFDPSLDVGDVVISTEVRHHDVDVTAFGYEYGQVPQLPAAFTADEKLMQTAIDSVRELGDAQVVSGVIATGDSFMNDPKRVEAIRDRFTGVQASRVVKMPMRLSMPCLNPARLKN